VDADLHLQMKVAADARTNRTHDLEHEARAVLERSAELVLPIVDGGAEELRDQIAVGAVQLDAIESSLARAPRPFGKRVDDLPDLLLGGTLASESM
jgi:hypothetical protein